MKLNEIISDTEFYQSEEDITAWIKENAEVSGACKMHPDGTVDVHGDLTFTKPIKRLMVKFRTVGGSLQFNFGDNSEMHCLETLDGFPHTVRGDLGLGSVLSLNVTTLKGCPTRVDGDFYLVDLPQITTFEGLPKSLRVLCIWESGITSLVGISKQLARLEHLQITPVIWSRRAQIKEGGIELLTIPGFKEVSTGYGANPEWANIINKYAGRPDDIYECQAELIDAGLEEHAKL